MDSALKLRLAFEQDVPLTFAQIDFMLADSKILKKLFQIENKAYLSAIFKIIGISEIPFAIRMQETKDTIQFINKNIATKQGFSYTGKVDDIVPCYNAMLLESYVRLGLKDSDEVKSALQWMKQYQVWERNKTTSWIGKGIKKHGGCMNAIPCYIGIGKSVRALITYDEYTNGEDPEVKTLIEKGLDYMLEHQMFLRLSDNTPISRNIIYNAFPQSYFLSFTDLVYIIAKTKRMDDPRAKKMMILLKDKEVALHQWKIEYIYAYKGYVGFETRRGTSEWLSSLYQIWLNKEPSGVNFT